MNTDKETEKHPDQTVHAMEPGHELSEPEPQAPIEPADLRETTEGGYGWGV